MEQRSPEAHDDDRGPAADEAIIQFGILCCAVAMAIVLAVAVVAS